LKEITYLEEAPAKEIIQLHAADEDGGYLLDYKDEHKTNTMRDNLSRYNQFIETQEIEVRLDAETPVSWQFLETRRGNVISRKIELIPAAVARGRVVARSDVRTAREAALRSWRAHRPDRPYCEGVHVGLRGRRPPLDGKEIPIMIVH
jgi:hypothetical protein